MTDICHDGKVLHLLYVLRSDDSLVSGSGDKNVDGLDDRLKLGYLVAIHRGLKSTNRVNFANDNSRTLTAKSFSRTLTYVTVAGNECDLATHENVGGSVQTVW